MQEVDFVHPEETFGICSKCLNEEELADGLCVHCWDREVDKQSARNPKKMMRENTECKTI